MHTTTDLAGEARRAEPLGEREPAAPEATDAARAAERRIDAETLLQAIERRLGTEALEAFLLYYEGGLSQAEVAEALGRDRGTVARRIREAHALLDRMQEPGEAGARPEWPESP